LRLGRATSVVFYVIFRWEPRIGMVGRWLVLGVGLRREFPPLVSASHFSPTAAEQMDRCEYVRELTLT
jgi:hypothetical protein